jgi:PAS domain S-box-containing protein
MQSDGLRVVGVGASAGGLQAFRQLLEHLPADTGMAFVIVQHLYGAHESLLAILLSKVTEMPVDEVRRRTRVKPNHVYVNPPNANMTIAENVLHLSPRAKTVAPQHPIDCFLSSLAKEKRSSAIGVILSGTGSDGTIGLKAIKAEGGLSFAQDENSATYYDMPRHAISAGCVDFELTSARIGEELARLARHRGRPKGLPYLTMQQKADRIILEKYAPASVLADSDGNVMRYRGVISAYLERASLKSGVSLLKVARAGLPGPLRSALQKAKESGAPVRAEGLHLKFDRRIRELNLEVLPITSGSERGFLVIFEPALPGPKTVGTRPSRRVAKESDAQRQQELQSTRVHLESVMEQQRTDNEALQSANEALQSSNEELQGLNAELNTIQEELQTSNDQLARSKEEVLRANSDLQNLLSSIQMPIIMVDHDLRIQRFTPMAKLLFNIVDADIGRPCTDLALTMDLPELPALLRLVMDTGGSAEQEVQDREGRWHSLQVRPYKTRRNTIEGAVIAMVDIDQLKRDREKLRLLVELSFEPIIVWDFDKGIVEWNQGCERLYGFTRADAVARHIHDLLRTIYPLPRAEFIAQLLARNVWNGELRQTSKDGRELIVESRLQTAEIAGRRVILETIHDITATRRAELNAHFIIQLDLAIAQIANADDIVRLSTGRLGEYLAASRCLLSEINREADVSNVREIWEGWPHDGPSLAGEYRGGDFLTPEIRCALDKGQALIVSDVTSDPRTRETASNYTRLGIVAVIATPILSEGRWEATLTVSCSRPRIWRPDEEQLMRDTAIRVWLAVKQSRSVALLRDREAQARRTLAEQMVAGVAECDRSGRFTMVNQRYCDIVGRTKRELLAMRENDITHPGDWPHNAEVYERLLESGESFFIEKRYRRGDGTDVWVNSHVSPIRNSQDEIEASVAVVVDVTGRKHAEEELRSAYERAEAATKAKDEFLSLVSHELRTPLTSIVGYTRLLRSAPADAELIQQVVEVVEKNGKAQLQLIEDLLDTARIMSGKLKLQVQPMDLAGVIRDALDVVRPVAQSKGIDLHAALDPLAGHLTGDPDRLEQTVWNLLSNAIKFTPQGGLVEITLARSDRYVEIVVRDTGKGIDAEFLPHLFARFRQSDISSARRAGGLGLGLALVKHIVELHGGTVEAASRGVNQGATFTVRLPVRAVYATPPADSKPGHDLEHHGTESLAGIYALVVDDEQDVRTLLTLTLESYGAKVQAVASGREALGLLAKQPPHHRFDVLLCDIAIPDEDGYTVIRKIRELPPDKGGTIPAIALTAYGRAEYRVRALEAGFQAHIVKPATHDELVDTIQSLVKHARLVPG